MTIDLNVFSRDPCFPSCKSCFAGADVLEHLKKYEQTVLRPQPRRQELFVSSSLERHPDVDRSSGRKCQDLVFVSLRVSMRGEFDIRMLGLIVIYILNQIYKNCLSAGIIAMDCTEL